MSAGGLEIRIDLSDAVKIATKLHGGKAGFKEALARGVNEAGLEAMRTMQAALPGQTGLPPSTFKRALKGKGGGGTYVIRSKGGDVRLKFFSPEETAEGVAAKPWNSRRVYAGTFMRSGWWPNRKGWVKGPNVVLRRVGQAKYPLRGVRSGLFIPEEMVTGQSKAAFEIAAERKLLATVEDAMSKLF